MNSIKKILKNKFIVATVLILLFSILMEVFVFNFSSWRTGKLQTQVITKDAYTDENLEYFTDVITVDGPVKNVDVKLQVDNHDTAYVMVILTDEGDKYEYITPEYAICDTVSETGFSNIYPFDDVHTIQLRIRTLEGCTAHIESVSINAHKPVDFKVLRFAFLFAVLWFGYLVWGSSALHNIYYDEKKLWQNIFTVLVILALLVLGKKISTADHLIIDSPWPHHKQYQELAHSLDMGTVELVGNEVSEGLLAAENPYDTIALSAEGVYYCMDYAYFNGKYYEYFGIVPELLLYYPYYKLKGMDLPNYKAVYVFYAIFVVGVFLTTSGFVKRYIKSIPYFFFVALNVATVLCANFVYLTERADIYNVPIIGAVSCTFMGIGLWLHGMSVDRRWLKIASYAVGSLFMALVAGCRPQLLIISAVAIVWFLFEGGIRNRKLFSAKTIWETIAFFLPYMLVAIVVGWYNFARFGNVLDFGATYSLTTNDMNHRGFNFSRLIRSLYYFLFQPATMSTDFPFLQASNVAGNYMGRFMSEFTYGGILVANAFFVSIWLWLLKGIKKTDKAIKAAMMILVAGAVIIAAFDANAAGVLYRYTCDFAPAFVLAAVMLWMLFLDRGQVLADYTIVSRIAYVCIILALCYSFMVFVANGSSVSLANDNRQLYYTLASYFKW